MVIELASHLVNIIESVCAHDMIRFGPIPGSSPPIAMDLPHLPGSRTASTTSPIASVTRFGCGSGAD
jgi:hypothetical protein